VRSEHSVDAVSQICRPYSWASANPCVFAIDANYPGETKRRKNKDRKS
jgi:hypothetical protein